MIGLIGQLWHLILYQPITNGLIGLYLVLNNLGLAIIALTLIIRLILVPANLPSMKAAGKMKEIAPKLEKLKKRYKGNSQGLAKAQMELYRQEGVNPASGFLPQIFQFIILIALYQVLRQVLGAQDTQALEGINKILYPSLHLNTMAIPSSRFWYLDLNKPDIIRFGGLPIPGLFLVASAIAQFVSSKLMVPAAKQKKKASKATPGVSDDLASTMQTQMVYLFPLMTIFIGFSFPSGLILYWLIFSLANLIQQLVINRKPTT